MLTRRGLALRSGPALTIGVLGLLALGACGGDDDDVSSGGDQPTATEPAPDETAATATEPASDGEPTPAGGGEPSAIDVCALISQTEVEAVVGHAVGPPDPVADIPPFYACHFGADVVIEVLVASSEEEALGAYEFDLEGNDYPPIDGLGDAAHSIVLAEGRVTFVSVLSGVYGLSVSVVDLELEADAKVDAETEIARIATDRLP